MDLLTSLIINFYRNGIVNLQGQWELYSNKLLTPQDLKNKSCNSYLNILSNLKIQLSGETTGYMTLRLRIRAHDNIVYGLRIKKILSASKVWVNGILQGKVGGVGEGYETEKAIFLPIYSYFATQNEIIDIVIQASNYRDLFPIIGAM